MTTLLDSNVQFQPNVTSHRKKQESKTHSKEKITEIVPEKDLIADILDKHLKTTVLKMLKELKERGFPGVTVIKNLPAALSAV